MRTRAYTTHTATPLRAPGHHLSTHLPPGRTFTATALVAVAALALSSCSAIGGTSAAPRGPSPTTDATTSATSTAPNTATSTPPDNSTSDAIHKLTDQQSVELTTDTLPPPPEGFNRDELDAFAQRAIDLIERGVSSQVATMNEDAAFKYVFANQYPSTTNETRKAFKAVSSKYSYAWVVASRFQQPPTEPAKVLAARWQVTTSAGQSIDGPAPVLQVVLSVAIEHRIPTTSGQTAPIVIQRTVIVRGFRPLGGPQWAPSVGYQASGFFGGKCALVNGGFLTPATRTATLTEDLRDLRHYLNKPKTITPSTSAINDLDQYVTKYCEDK